MSDPIAYLVHRITEDPDIIAHYARGVAEAPDFMACVMRRYQMAHGLNDQQLADTLKMDVADLDSLRLCRHPRHARWEEDTTKIAVAVGCDREALAELASTGLRIRSAPWPVTDPCM